MLEVKICSPRNCCQVQVGDQFWTGYAKPHWSQMGSHQTYGWIPETFWVYNKVFQHNFLSHIGHCNENVWVVGWQDQESKMNLFRYYLVHLSSPMFCCFTPAYMCAALLDPLCTLAAFSDNTWKSLNLDGFQSPTSSYILHLSMKGVPMFSWW